MLGVKVAKLCEQETEPCIKKIERILDISLSGYAPNKYSLLLMAAADYLECI